MGCGRVSWQFLLLLWKNFKLQFRRPIGTVFELLLPILATVFVIALRFALSFTNENRCFVTFPSDQLVLPGAYPIDLPNTTYNIFYTPDNEDTNAVMDLFREQVDSSPMSLFNISAFATEEAMVRELMDLANTTEMNTCYRNGAGIIFNNLNGTNLEYTIRLRHEVGQQSSWRTIQASPDFDLPGPRVTNWYLSEGFLHLQKLVGEAIVEWRTVKAGMQYQRVNISMRQFPYPEYSIDLFLSGVGNILPLLFVMAFLFSAGIIVKELVLEKESRIRESMLMMGLKQWVLWAAWFVKQFIFLFISVLVMSILLRFGVFVNSDYFLLLIFFVLVAISMISFCFIVSVWFDSARVGLIVGFVAWFANYFPFLFLQGRFSTLSLGAKLGASLLSNTALGFGVEVIARLEQRGSGLRWTNVADPIAADDPFSMGWVFAMLIIDSVLYMTVAWYVNAVKPGQYGVAKPFYFFLLPSYWCSTPRGLVRKKESKLLEGGLQVDPSAHEEVTGNPEVGISIRNLTKIYSQFFGLKKGRRKAVDNFNLDMYKGQITALLGHNGAGKTTTMSILTGLYTPTEGTATINGYSILTDMDLIRNSLGICPQHNVLFDRLTVREHLTFFMRLKGIHDRKKINAEVNQMIDDLLLSDKGDIQASRLSGGMKRKLSVGIALIGGSEVVILDEPTSGMDPYARRATWDLLTKYKQNCCMLLTTHFMDEADLLGDRIAIMAEGQLRCSGSSLFLKSRYGVGYHMTIVKEPSCVSSEVERLVKSFVPSAEQVTDVGAELSFILPSSAAAKFPDLFDQLDARKSNLGVASFGVSVTTMEEVFIKVGEGTDESLENRLRHGGTLRDKSFSPAPIGQTKSPPPASDGSDTFSNPMTIEELEANSGGLKSGSDAVQPAAIDEPLVKIKGGGLEQEEEQLTYQFYPNKHLCLWLQQFWAMFLKRFYTSIRFYPALITQFLLPVLFVVFGLLVVVTSPDRANDPPRALLLSNSGLDSRNTTLFFAEFEGSVGLSNFSAEELYVTDYFDIAGSVNSLRDSLSPIDDPIDCCNYHYQILDKFCASMSAEELMQCSTRNTSFGYNRCIDNCLACCKATDIRFSVLSTCTNPLTFSFAAPSNDLFCPTPPALSIYSTTSGLLDTINTFVAEHLLRTSTSTQDLDVVTFFRRYQAGFTVTAPDPIVSICDNLKTNGSSLLGRLAFGGLRSLSCNESDPTEADQTCLAYTSPVLTNCTLNASLTSRTPSCFSVDPITAGFLQLCSCGEGDMSCGAPPEPDLLMMDMEFDATDPPMEFPSQLPVLQRSISKVYPEQLPVPPTVTVWYNNGPFHMVAAALNAFQQMRLQNFLGKGFSLTVINHPLPRNDTSLVQQTLFDFTGFGLSIMVIFGYSFLLANFVLLLVKEKESKAKHLQFVSGVNAFSYWLSTLLWDMLNALLPVFLTIIVFRAFPEEAYHGEALGAIFLVLFLTCWAGIPLTYVFSFFFSNSLAAFAVLVLIFYFISLMLFSVVFLVQVFGGTNGPDNADILHYIFLLSPTYGLATALNDIYLNQRLKNVCLSREIFCRGQGINYVDNILTFSRPGIGIICLYLFLQGLLFFTITLLLEFEFFTPKLRGCLLSLGKRKIDTSLQAAEPLLPGEDADVYAERKRVRLDSTSDGDAVVIKGLVKVYRSHLSGCNIRPSKTAVAGISLGIPSGECFGLLGVNGAGKTTTFSILTGDIGMTSGTAVIAGYDIRSNLSDVQQRVGYCPQFDALIERMTGRELLVMFARLRGVPESQIKEVVDTEIRRLDLKKYANKLCGTYSGGNKRKLSTAIAMVGNPPIVMLDEPTTGMDPNTRRYLWDVLTNVTREGRSIILTSHSMEECEALCTRLAIMVNGQFKCLGSIQHLKNKFGAGFTLQAKVRLLPGEHLPEDTGLKKGWSLRRQGSGRGRQASGSFRKNPDLASYGGASSETASQPPPIPLNGGGQVISAYNPYDTTSLHIFIREAFSGAILMEEHQGSVTYQLPSAGVTWSSVFRQLESNKQRLGIVDYSVSQTTLEQVFINFAKEQEEEAL